jgi:F-type H+-transporting ATPase subunit b
MKLIMPEIGLIFWMTLCFILLILILKKYAWKPILRALDERERGIESALSKAQEAREKIEDLQKNQDQIIKEAKKERELILNEAKKLAEEYRVQQQKIINEEMTQKMARVKESIEMEKRAAINDLKKNVATLSLDIAEGILEKKLGQDLENEEFIKRNLEKLEI